MRKRFTLCLLLLLSVCFLWNSVTAEYDPVIVRVGDYTYTRSQIMKVLESAINSYEAMGETLTNEDITEMKQEIVAAYLEQGIVDNKLHELGMDTMTDEDEIELTRRTNETFSSYQKEYIHTIMEKYGCNEEKASRAATILMDLDGINFDTLKEQEKKQMLNQRIISYIAKDAPRMTDDEVLAWYQENFVRPFEKQYAGDIETFEKEVLLGGGMTYYIPEGYRYVQTILFNADQALQEEAYLLRGELTEAQQEAERLDNVLYGTRLLGEDDTQASKDLEDGRNAVAEKENQIKAIYEKMAEPFEKEIDQLKVRLESGESFEALRTEYDTNPSPSEKGYLVCAESIVWEDAFRDAAMLLNEPGEWVGPVMTGAGVQFLCYVEDAPQGAYPMEMGDPKAVKEQAQRSADSELLLSYAAIWQSEYEVETHPELLIIH